MWRGMFCCRAGMNISLCWLQRICTTLRNSSRRNRRRMWVKMKSLTHLMANRYLATSSHAPPHSYGAVFCHPFDVLLLFCPRPDRGAEYCDEHVCLSVCLSLCLFVSISSELHVWSSPDTFFYVFKHSCMLLMVMAWSCSGSIAISCVLLVLWMTFYLHICRVSHSTNWLFFCWNLS